ncbi:class I SAM-dependent methyltransferase [Xanthocytophaga agilis]|uniref:Class I SAM-dependent methyltransferase n=1 Tax=Xanthocytophaga agilis TaxID=3048010 RepID=A0AAE3R5K7_9BACT|nr:class I SAM-dependent methyltransferase [Xanthocytophaga agilis]MDJ1501805.1 class I SAM-dependent methyltransferase [Xanthocytophaga agilis]
MKENCTLGTTGYATVIPKFIDATLAIDFTELHQDFLPYIPSNASRILDIGAGIGRDAFVLAQMGHSVVAVEPTHELRLVGEKLFDSKNIKWVDDSLPALSLLDDQLGLFDFILASGVWHHLNEEEQSRSMQRVAQLLIHNGIFALTLRHGPSGAGTHVFPINPKRTIQHASQLGLKPVLILENQPSLMKNKENVFWTKLVFQKQ